MAIHEIRWIETNPAFDALIASMRTRTLIILPIVYGEGRNLVTMPTKIQINSVEAESGSGKTWNISGFAPEIGTVRIYWEEGKSMRATHVDQWVK